MLSYVYGPQREAAGGIEKLNTLEPISCGLPQEARITHIS